MQFLRKKLNIKKFDLCAVVLLLLIAYFFRLWKLKSLQYWSDDEQLIWAIIRHIIVDKHLSLVIPNAAIEMSLGPLFHYLVFPWFWLVNLDPEKILLLGNIFTFFGIILMFIAGNLIGGKKVGFIAAFLYSVSFISSLFDRRLWALSPNIALVLLGIISLIQILKGKSKYIILLVVPLVFSVNSDPSLGVIALTTFP